jgi:hypothetical protein
VRGAGGADGTDGTDVEDVRRFWERLGLPGLVDVHTHFMPERVLRKVWDYFDALGPLTGGVEWPITYRAEESERLALIRGFGVRAFTAMLYPHKAGMAQWLNSWAVDFAAGHPTVCTPRPCSPNRASRGTYGRPWSKGLASSRRTSRWGRTTRVINSSTPPGGCSPRPGSPS